jgi:2-C-methyl-D-erythritol 4-phosphate cytidylyltransferase
MTAFAVAPPRCHVLIPCAGTGSRAGGDLPKQYQPLAGRALVLHTLSVFVGLPEIATVSVVVAPGDGHIEGLLGAAETMPGEARAPRILRVGGATRAASVAAGLAALRAPGIAADEDWVLVHDAARCLVTPAQVRALIAACVDDAVGGLLALPLADTLKQARLEPEGVARVAATLPRADKWLAQTPQMFRAGVLARALAHADEAVTDEASAVEALGCAPRLVAASAQNFKVTYAEDFALAEAVLRARDAATPGH